MTKTEEVIPFKVGDRVLASSEMYSGVGTIVFINQKDLFKGHFLPVQVELDKGDSHGHKMKRFALKELAHYDK